MKAFDYAVAKNMKGALEAMQRGYHPKAAGIDLLDLLKERIAPTDKVVSLHKLSGLKGIREDEDGALVIGALTTLQELADDARIQRDFKVLAHAAGDAATPQVRALATAGGNLCQRPRCWYFRSLEHPCLKRGGATCYAVDGENQFHAIMGGGPCHIVHPSNLAPALVALDARILISSGTETRTVEASRFFVPPSRNMYSENALEEGELVTEIRLPKKPVKSGYSELRQKQSFDWPMVSCSVAHLGGGNDDWRVVLGFVAPVPWRSREAEQALAGAATVTEELAKTAADAALANAQPMSRNAWRVQVARAAVRRALLDAEGKDALS